MPQGFTVCSQQSTPCGQGSNMQGNRFMEVGGVSVVQLVRILRARLNLALNQLRPARWDIKSILAADPNSPQVHPLSQTHLHCDADDPLSAFGAVSKTALPIDLIVCPFSHSSIYASPCMPPSIQPSIQSSVCSCVHLHIHSTPILS